MFAPLTRPGPSTRLTTRQQWGIKNGWSPSTIHMCSNVALSFNVKGSRSIRGRKIRSTSSGHEEQRNDLVKSTLSDSGGEQAGGCDQENIAASENEVNDMNGKGGIIRRLARAVATFLPPHPSETLSKFFSFRALKLVFFLLFGMSMSYLGSRRSSGGKPRYEETSCQPSSPCSQVCILYLVPYIVCS